jgi:anti-sigma-K factor RskA
MSVDIHTLAGAYALDALDDLERAAFARHMTECEACAQEVAEYLDTTGRLADLSATPPPERLRVAVLDEVARTRQAPVRTSGRPRQGRARRWVAAVAAGVVIAAGAATGTYVVQEHRVREAQTQASAAAEIQRVLSAPDARVANTSLAGGTVVAVTSASLNQGVVFLRSFPSPGPKAYQLWMIYPDRTTSVALLPAGASDGTRVIAGVSGATALGISVEPAGGSAQPTSMVGSVSMT